MLALKRYRTRMLWCALAITISGFAFYLCLPNPLFKTKCSAVLEDRSGELLGAMTAEDGQWRFPASNHVSPKFATAIVQFEDKRFYRHFGVDPLAIARAIRKNILFKKIKSGGSTLTMQTIRLSRSGKPRSIWEKAIEAILSIRLECSYSKEEIMTFYVSNAPFGSNVVGLDAAAWRYFGKKQDQLSWGEATMLAVLPNSPSLVHPGKNRNILLQKRNRLLDKLKSSGAIDEITCVLAKAEPLPAKPVPLPQYAPHLLARAQGELFIKKSEKQPVIKSTLDKNLQLQVDNVLQRHHQILRSNGINNEAALVVDVETGEVLAYVGNISSKYQRDFENDVDIIRAPRSTGSILKPLLFAAMLNEGEILPKILVPDIPTQIAGYSPQNFNKDYDGAVPAQRALERSLNVPAVRMLRNYGVGKFHSLLKETGMTTINQPPDHYGLSLILGGAEGTMWDIAGVYASMARTLNHFEINRGRYAREDFHPLHYILKEDKSISGLKHVKGNFLSAASIWCTFNAMEEVSRPDMDNNWKQFSSSQRVAWKTGTSFGFRDGWAIGCTPKYVVMVWVGNADGEGRPGLTGISTAAPILFDIFKLLKTSEWFNQPYSEMKQVEVCTKSGHRALEICEMKEMQWIPVAGLKTRPCPYHTMVHLDRTGRWRVNSDCEATSNMLHRSWFVLPATEEWFYKSKNTGYKILPSYRNGCINTEKSAVMEFIYPQKSTKIYVPVMLDGKSGKTVFEVAHRSTSAIIYWHMDEEYLGYTKNFHQMELSPGSGKHSLTVVDENGERQDVLFEILSK
jgi:penicillin-binding protein 1C